MAKKPVRIADLLQKRHTGKPTQAKPLKDSAQNSTVKAQSIGDKTKDTPAGKEIPATPEKAEKPQTKSKERTASKPTPKLTKTTSPQKEKKPRGMKKENEFQLFIDWLSTPFHEKAIKTQVDFAKEIGVDNATLSDWKRREGFYEEVGKRRKKWAMDRTADLIGALYTQILTSRKPTGRDVMVWFQLMENYNPKLLVEDETPPLDYLPEEQREQLVAAMRLTGLDASIKVSKEREAKFLAAAENKHGKKD